MWAVSTGSCLFLDDTQAVALTPAVVLTGSWKAEFSGGKTYLEFPMSAALWDTKISQFPLEL